MEVVPSLNPGKKPIFFFFMLDLNMQMWHIPVISPAATGIYREVNFYFSFEMTFYFSFEMTFFFYWHFHFFFFFLR